MMSDKPKSADTSRKNYVCVECGSNVETLYHEFSLGNIKLTRCTVCKSVADKYIEHELILVAIDIALHRIQAYRHVLFNRKLLDSNDLIDIRLIFLANIVINCFFKLIVLHNSYPDEYSNMYISCIFFSSTILEHLIFITCIFMSVLALRRTLSMDEIFLRHLYISISFPEVGKVPILLLLTWDNGDDLLFLVGLLTASIQLLSLQAVSRASTVQLATTLSFAIAIRTSCRLLFYSLKDVYWLGII